MERTINADNRTLGERGERIAAEYLESRGLRILDRNWRSGHGELDLVARDGAQIVAVEVKTRSGTGTGSPLQAITMRKASRLRRILFDWVRSHGARGSELRVDAVAIILRPGAAPRIDHLQGIA